MDCKRGFSFMKHPKKDIGAFVFGFIVVAALTNALISMNDPTFCVAMVMTCQ